MGLQLVNGEIIDTEAPTVSARFYENAKKVGIGEFQETVYIELKARGSKDSMCREMRESDKSDYPDAWAAYEANQEADNGESPLNLLPGLKVAFRRELEDMGVTTIEQLAAMDKPDKEYLFKPWALAKRFVEIAVEADDG